MDTDVSVTPAERWTNNIAVQEPQSKWVATLFVQFRFLYVDESSEHQKVLTQFRDLLENIVGYHRGDVVALSRDAGLAIFSGPGRGHDYTQNAILVATSLIEEANNTNRERLARNLSPVRLGIGVDGGPLSTGMCNRHPRLDPSLQPYLDRARRLSELNYQAPFPAIFISHTVADRLEQEQRYAVQNLGDVLVENHADPFSVYAVLGE